MRLWMTAISATLTFSILAFSGIARATTIDSKANETNPIDTHEYLVRFHANPMKVMNTPLARTDGHGNVVHNSSSPFGENISPEEMLKARDGVRAKICANSARGCAPVHKPGVPGTYSAYTGLNEISKFVIEPTYLTKLADMEAKNLLQAQTPRAPWSDSYWPVAKGLVARRWLDPAFPDSRTFIDNYNYFLAAPPMAVALNVMSPAEKYDYLVGDGSYRLTQANWREGKLTWDQRGTVPGWAGICHGWSPAAVAYPAPKHDVTLVAANGTPVTFYPSDIKALASSAMAESPPKTYVAGTRCQVSRPKEDENGRVIDEGCFDVNPGTWHIGVVHEMGENKRGFVADTQYDYQIWNYPVYSYRYSYFNPQTLDTSDTLGGATIRMSDFSVDKFKKYRSPKSKFVVGVTMEISFAIETAPSTHPYQVPKLQTQKMLYDLELDDDGNIIGGEWYSNFHPDFMWHFEPDSKPVSDYEHALPTPLVWDGSTPFPDSMRDAAMTASGRMQPLDVVIETLVTKSQE